MARRAISPEARKVGAAAFCGAIAAAALGLAATAGTPEAERSASGKSSGDASRRASTGSTEIQLLGVNDFHGNLESPKAAARDHGGAPVPIGGAATLHAHLDRAERSHPGRTIRVHAGDMVGASPLLSSHFHDEPSIRAMNLMEFDVGTLGNHEFDEGGAEIERMLRGGQRRDGHQFKRDHRGRMVNTSAADFEGVNFPYTAANTVDREGLLALPPTKIIERDGARIGFIGVTTTTTRDYVLPEHAGRFRFLDISDTVNRETAALQRAGVQAIVVLAHSGAYHAHGDSGAARGEIVDEARQMTSAVDVVIAGHTHSHLNTRVPNTNGKGDKLVIEANSLGIAYDRVRMTVDRASGHVLSKTGDTPRTWADEVAPQPHTAALVADHARRIAPLSERVVGRAERRLSRNRAGARRGSVGAVAARAQRQFAKADIAFVNEGNARGDIAAGPITYAELFRASAYEHQVLRMTMRGSEVREVLQEQFTHEEGHVLLHLAGLDFERDGDRVGRVTLADGRRLDPRERYTVAANELLLDRGGFETLHRHGNDARPVGTDLEALVSYVERAETIG